MFFKLVNIPSALNELYKAYQHKLIQDRLRIAFLFSILLVPSGSFFDYLIFPELWTQLLLIRTLSVFAYIFLAILFLNTALNNRPIIICHILNIFVALTIVLLSNYTGSYKSPYYAGLNLIFICIAMAVPMGIRDTVIAGLNIILLHIGFNVIPHIINKEMIEWSTLWNSVYFLTFTFSMIVISSAIMEHNRRLLFISIEEEKRKGNLLIKHDQEKREFISNITHELKTPLSIVMGNAEMALEYFDDPKIHNMMEVINKASLQLANHVDRIITVSLADDPNAKPDLGTYDYCGIVQNCYSLFENQAQSEGKTFGLNMCKGPLVVSVDIIRIEEVLNNLIQNAFKYTPQNGGIAVTVTTDEVMIYTEIIDTGVGISPDKVDKIFDRMYQADDVLSKRHGGMGLGLYICKKNIEIHGGKIQAHSTHGKGTTFKFTLPLYVDQTASVKNAPFTGTERRATPRRKSYDRRLEGRLKKFEYQQQRGIEDLAKMANSADVRTYENEKPSRPTILIVEDNAGMMKVIVEALHENYNLILAFDAYEALRKVETNSDRIWLILSDIMMPGMNGYDFCKRLSSYEHLKHVPLVFISALMNQEDQLKGYEIGATDYIVKPYNIKILKEKVSSWISRRQYELLLKTLSNTLDSKVHQLSIVHEVLQHEVRNPIQLITHANYFIQRIRLLRQGNISEEENECWHQVEKITSGLSGLNSVLTTTKSIELDAITSQKAILLSEIITNAISQTEYLMHSVTFESFSEIDENCKVVCDKGMITQVLVNIIRNATESIRDCKSNEGGSIILRCENGENNTALIKIEDNGVGIAPEILPNLFRFKFSTKKDGSGIGLHLSRIILKMHGGNIDAKSEKGKGATFILTLLKF